MSTKILPPEAHDTQDASVPAGQPQEVSSTAQALYSKPELTVQSLSEKSFGRTATVLATTTAVGQAT